MDRKILKGIRSDLVAINRVHPPTYHRLENRNLKRTAMQIHNARIRVEKKHPPGCNCPYHGGHR